LTQADLAQLLGVDAVWVRAWETERHPLPSSYLYELGAMGMDTARLTLGQPGVWLPDSLLPDARLLRYCWRGLPVEVKALLRGKLLVFQRTGEVQDG